MCWNVVNVGDIVGLSDAQGKPDRLSLMQIEVDKHKVLSSLSTVAVVVDDASSHPGR